MEALPVVGSLLGADAANSAANAQAAGAQAGVNEQRRQFDIIQQNTAPMRQAGYSANNLLATLLGLAPPTQSTSGPTTTGNYQEIRNRLLPQYTTQTTGGYADNGAQSVIDEPALQRAIAAEMQGQSAQGPQLTVDPNNPQYGSLIRDITQEDIRNDPVYAMSADFGYKQGQQALQRAAAAAGRLGSGRFVKDSTRFANDYATTQAGNAYNRLTANKSNKFNFLAPVIGIGQTATQQANQAGMNFANQAANLYANQADARASGFVGQNNALQQGLGSIYAWGKNNGLGSTNSYGNTSGYVPTLTDWGNP